MISISEFQIKDVVNVSNGKKLGSIGDIDINVTTGKIQAIILGGSGKVLGFFGKEEEMIIPWRNIVKIGEDVILVRVNEPKGERNPPFTCKIPEISMFPAHLFIRFFNQPLNVCLKLC